MLLFCCFSLGKKGYICVVVFDDGILEYAFCIFPVCLMFFYRRIRVLWPVVLVPFGISVVKVFCIGLLPIVSYFPPMVLICMCVFPI